ncbi:MAG: MarR family transcriptional regulator [Gemmatimonadota bacterium]|nr:MarR family transcriptional regulator [Gemmatimonadota bacterium]
MADVPVLTIGAYTNYNGITMSTNGHKRKRSPTSLSRAINSLRRIVRAARGATQAVESRYGISSAQLYILQALAETPGMSIKDVVALTLTTNSSVSEVVGRLVDAGLVVREIAADDRRRKVLTLTEGGREVVRHSPRTIQQTLVEGFYRLTTKDQHALADSLEEWCRLSGFGDVPATMLFDPPSTELSPQSARHPGTEPSSPTH